MAIQDVLTPVDLVPGLGGQGRHDAPVPAGEAQPSSSEYQRALSRTLNEGTRRDQGTESTAPPAREENSSPAAEENRAESATAHPEPRSASESHQASPESDHDKTTVTDAENQNQVTPPPEDEASSDAGVVVDSAELVETQTDSLEVLASVPIIVAEIADAPLKPPAELSTLFAPTADDAVPAEVNLQVQPPAEDLVIRPPSGLFESEPLPIVEQEGSVALLNGQTTTGSEGNAASVDGLTVVDSIQPQLAEGVADVPGVNTFSIETDTADVIPDESQPHRGQLSVAAETNESASLESTTTESIAPSLLELDTNFDLPGPGQPTQSENDGAANASATKPPATIADAGPNAVTNESAQQATVTVEVAGQPSPLNGEHPRQASPPPDESVQEAEEAVQGISSANDVVVSTAQGAEPQRAASVAGGTDAESHPESTNLNETSRSAPVAATPAVSSTTTAPRDSGLDVSLSGQPRVEPEQLVERVASAVQAAPQNGQQLRVRLYPPHLGALQVEVTSHGGTLTVQMEVQTVAAQRALTENMAMLRDALISQGTVLDRVDVQLVETTPEEGRSDLTDEQQQHDQRQEQDAEGQSAEENEEPQEAEGADNKQKPVSANAGIDELDIQV